ncbi:integrase core domain-containing [Paramuricea clavata]|uniref:Integrase core domain-containing n=1 Tax=Paramuricea clavata TaxID=317549 RepID=A0A6S7GLA6_PARCT|nr:integrase core domain-containing [Paramuricea clavata]
MTKAVECVLVQFKEKFGRYPKTAQFDDGKEFYNVGVKTLLKDHDVHYFSTWTFRKAAIVERFNRTLKTRMWKYFTENRTKVWVVILPDLVRSYNNSTHRTIGMKPADVNEENKDEVWTRIYGYPLSSFPNPKFKVGDHVRVEIKHKTFEKGYEPNFDNEVYVVTAVFRGDPNMYSLKDPEDGAEGGEDETVIDDTPIDEDDFLSGLDDDQRLDDVKTSSFREENKNDSYRKRKRQLDELSTYGKFDDIKIEYVRRLFQTEYRIDPTDGRNSKEFISSLDITKNKLTFNGADVAYIDTGGTYKMSENKKATASSRRFLNLYEKSLAEHRERSKSVVEEETGGEASGVNAEEIFEDAEEEFRQEVINAGDNLVEHARELGERGKITTQERMEFAGVTAPKEPPEVRIKALREQKKVFETNIELETDPERRQIMQEGRDVAEQGIDNANLEMGQQPETEEGKHRYREIVRENIRTNSKDSANGQRKT